MIKEEHWIYRATHDLEVEADQDFQRLEALREVVCWDVSITTHADAVLVAAMQDMAARQAQEIASSITRRAAALRALVGGLAE